MSTATLQDKHPNTKPGPATLLFFKGITKAVALADKGGNAPLVNSLLIWKIGLVRRFHGTQASS